MRNDELMNGLDFKFKRYKLRLTQTAVARKLNISRHTLSAYESGGANIPITIALKLAKLYNATDEEINRIYPL